MGITKSALISQFESSNIYLNAISDIYNEELVVTMMESNLSDFALLSDTVLETLASTLADQFTNYGINVSKYEIFHHSNMNLLVFAENPKLMR